MVIRIRYYQFIEENLFHARRDAGRSAWSEDVLPKLDETRTHLNERRKHEAAIIDSIRSHVAHARGEARDRLLELMNTIEDCQQRHAGLLKRVMTASEEFRQIQASAFRVTDLYNARPQWLDDAHAARDASVAAAYGWAPDIPKDDALEALLELNRAQSTE